ncbi:hypothetical protein DFP73DRAFT_562953 [Morchella snyderi]|nr:hypothetical protein DFP73DRAFT_562953 [Morchella snyderi]
MLLPRPLQPSPDIRKQCRSPAPSLPPDPSNELARTPQHRKSARGGKEKKTQSRGSGYSALGADLLLCLSVATYLCLSCLWRCTGNKVISSSQLQVVANEEQSTHQHLELQRWRFLKYSPGWSIYVRHSLFTRRELTFLNRAIIAYTQNHELGVFFI